MFETAEFLAQVRLDAKILEVWIEAGWLLPRRELYVQRFSEIDVARAQLIRDLQQDLGVNDEGITIILDLLDQIHGLRRTLGDLLSAADSRSAAGQQPTAAAAERTQDHPGTTQHPPKPTPSR